MNQAHAMVGAAQLAQHIDGAVARIVINKNDLPIEADQATVEPVHQLANIVAFVERRNDDRESGQIAQSAARIRRPGNVSGNAGAHFRERRYVRSAAQDVLTRVYEKALRGRLESCVNCPSEADNAELTIGSYFDKTAAIVVCSAAGSGAAAFSTMRQRSPMMRFSSKSFGV